MQASATSGIGPANQSAHLSGDSVEAARLMQVSAKKSEDYGLFVCCRNIGNRIRCLSHIFAICPDCLSTTICEAKRNTRN